MQAYWSGSVFPSAGSDLFGLKTGPVQAPNCLYDTRTSSYLVLFLSESGKGMDRRERDKTQATKATPPAIISAA